MMSGLLRAAVAAALVCTGTASQAADFYFSFGTDTTDPSVTNGFAGTVTGRILGLPDDGTGGALQVLIDSYSPNGSLTFPIDANTWLFSSDYQNSFTVENGTIVAALFRNDDFTFGGDDQFMVNILLGNGGGTNYVSLDSNNASSIWNNQGFAGVTFTRIDAAVPEPGTWALMLLGFGAAGVALRSRRKRSVVRAAVTA